MKPIFSIKTYPLLLALAAGGAVASRAQGVKFGLKGGPSYTSVVGPNVAGANYKWGFHGGVLVNFQLNDRFSLQPEALYSQKGTRGDDNRSRINIYYVDVPVLLRVAAGTSGLFIELGPQVGYIASSDASLDSRSSLARVTTDFAGSYPTFDLGYATGFGYQLANGLGLGLRYNGGFRHVLKGATDNDTACNSAFQLYLSAMLGSSK